AWRGKPRLCGIESSPPLALFALLALYWSRQVCMRALPADSLEYFDDTALGKTASPAAAGTAAGFGAGVVFACFAGAAAGAVAVGAGVDGAGAAAGGAAGAGDGAGAAFALA